MIGKFVTKLIQSLPTWDVTKYYGKVCIYQLKCLKYKVQTSEAWFNFKCKFMPGSLRNELECEEPVEHKVKNESKQQKLQQNILPEIKSQKNVQYTSKNHKASLNSHNDLKDTYFIDEFVSKAKKQKKQEDQKYQETEKYSMHDDYVTKKERKVKRAQ